MVGLQDEFNSQDQSNEQGALDPAGPNIEQPKTEALGQSTPQAASKEFEPPGSLWEEPGLGVGAV
jgi:hypothetical protein